MRLENAFHVPLPVEEAWTLLTDLPRIAPCLPGAHLDEVVDGEYRGGLSTKIGPITAKYRGTARFVEHDDIDHRGVIEARGREERGSGTAAATVTAHLRPEDGGTRVEVSTELAISGRAAQFGRSLLSEVSTMLIDQFTARLEALIRDGAVAPAEQTEQTLDVGTTVVLPLLRRAAVPAAVAVAAGVIGYLLGRRNACRAFPSPTSSERT
ncbi:carbon monoxide dehydrogenase subunit G [Actinomadura sp. NBRC 104412]|uniref:SRPBCC family protein n=1 Tax=Actinomadura sp. NBRC 104412 TaxID=3032203 RepID=UPI0024A5D965|nr:SRPBCC family protein [Actinomadura sp. NBRC 104412]GLZ02871.1 carbon monoxide dehydrogenase subunit G [Actinomadura sp. NBRC 104412]